MIGAAGLFKFGKRDDGTYRLLTRLEFIVAVEVLDDADDGAGSGLIHLLGGAAVELSRAEALDIMENLERAAGQLQYAPLVQPAGRGALH